MIDANMPRLYDKRRAGLARAVASTARRELEIELYALAKAAAEADEAACKAKFKPDHAALVAIADAAEAVSEAAQARYEALYY